MNSPSTSVSTKLRAVLGVAVFVIGETLVLTSIILIMRATVINPYDISNALLIPAGMGLTLAVAGVLTFGPLSPRWKG